VPRLPGEGGPALSAWQPGVPSGGHAQLHVAQAFADPTTVCFTSFRRCQIGCGLADLHRPVPVKLTGSKPRKLVAGIGVTPIIAPFGTGVMSAVSIFRLVPAIQRSKINVWTLHGRLKFVKCLFQTVTTSNPHSRKFAFPPEPSLVTPIDCVPETIIAHWSVDKFTESPETIPDLLNCAPAATIPI